MKKIVGYFANVKTAKDTLEKLKRSGFENSAIDLNDHYIDERNVQTNLPGTEASPSLSGLVLKSGMTAVDRSKGPLTAASPMVSGLGTFDEIADFNCRLIIQTDNPDKAAQIIKSNGGTLDNPNIQMPKRLEDVDLQ
ncbi:MAG TPA: hypothetical protein VHT34_11050 [Clostridia bacterium]|nr:hypothetical protein [Clostridia bacterium]